MKTENANPNTGQNGQIKAMKKLLVPIDFSECSRQALRYALSQARQSHGEVTLVNVIPDGHTSYEYGVAEAIEVQEQRRKHVTEDLAKLADDSFQDVRHQFLVKSGRPFEEIVNAARDLDADLIIISTHGYPGNTRVDLGSTTERVVRYAPCPVLVVRSANPKPTPTA